MPAALRWLLGLALTNPIAVRLVQNASRRPRHLYIRSVYLAALILVLLWSLLVKTSGGSLGYRDLAAAGAESFTYVAYLQIALICVLAPVFMGGAIAQEANPKTWDILLTTPITSLQVVLGNLFGRLFFVLALLFASLPLFAITQYFGGVPARAILGSYAVAAGAALVVGTSAIALSVSRLVGKRAFFIFYVAVVSYLAVTAALDRWLIQAGLGASGGNGVTWMTALNPFLALHALISPSGYPRAPSGTPGLAGWFLAKPVTTWFVLSSGVSFVLVVVSTLTVRLGGLQTLAVSRSGVPWYRAMVGLGAAGAEHRPPREVSENPIAWREAAARNATLGRILARWFFVLAGLGWGGTLLVLHRNSTLDAPSLRLALDATVLGEMGVIALVAINMAATAISREREDGTLDLLLTTPITPSAYLTGKLRGLVAYLLPMLAVPVLTLMLAGLYTFSGGLGGGATLTTPMPGGATIAEPLVLPEAGLLAPLVFLPFAAFCVMVGLHWSLRSKGTIGSMVGTVGVVGAVSGVVGLCGWQSGQDLGMLGPVLAATSPATFAHACVAPVDALYATVSESSLESARVALTVGAVVAALGYGLAVYLIHMNMVRTFDMTVRKLAGSR